MADESLLTKLFLGPLRRASGQKPKKLEKISLNDKFFDWDYLHLTALKKETYFNRKKGGFVLVLKKMYIPRFLENLCRHFF